MYWTTYYTTHYSSTSALTKQYDSNMYQGAGLFRLFFFRMCDMYEEPAVMLVPLSFFIFLTGHTTECIRLSQDKDQETRVG